jgi:hypothetical protein
MKMIIQCFFQKKEDYEKTLKGLFEAADLDGNNLIEFSEVTN